MKIYTKKGDSGKTSLLGGMEVYKDDARLEAYGSLDELNATLGLLISKLSNQKHRKKLISVQNILFQLGSLLASPKEKRIEFKLKSIEEDNIKTLDEAIDLIDAGLPALKNFILPGGSESSAICHLARVICRRSERQVVRFFRTADDEIPYCLEYLNRLSDYLFVLGRDLNYQENVAEIIWKN